MTILTKPRAVPAYTYSGNLAAVKASPIIKGHKIVVKVYIPSIYTPADKETGTPEDHGKIWEHVELQCKLPDADQWETIEAKNIAANYRTHETEDYSLFRLRKKTTGIEIAYTLHRPHYQYNQPLTEQEIADHKAREQEHEDTKLDRLKESLIEAIKSECESKILKVASRDKQRNLTAEMTQMSILYGKFEDWTDEQQERGLELQSIFARINALREASNTIEGKIQGQTFEQLQAFDISSGWPE